MLDRRVKNHVWMLKKKKITTCWPPKVNFRCCCCIFVLNSSTINTNFPRFYLSIYSLEYIFFVCYLQYEGRKEKKMLPYNLSASPKKKNCLFSRKKEEEEKRRKFYLFRLTRMEICMVVVCGWGKANDGETKQEEEKKLIFLFKMKPYQRENFFIQSIMWSSYKAVA